MIYLDNAATSFPKPCSVAEEMQRAMVKYCANPGRSGHRLSMESAAAVFETRQVLNDFFSGFGEEYVSFFPNCTYALNAAIMGYVKSGEHIVISSLEHNSVLRPVHRLKEQGVADYSIFTVSDNENETLENFKNSFKENTSLCVCTAVSNVFGNILPIEKLSEIAHSRGAKFFVDGAQGAGIIDLNMKNQNTDCLCVPGHKGLLGPMGTGALLHNNLDFEPVITGGTGTSSLDFSQPSAYPERLESGTLNVWGIAGLKKGVEYVKKKGINNIFKEESALCSEFFYGLKAINNVELYREEYDEKHYGPLVSFNIKNIHSERVAAMLNEGGFCVRGGFHCAPLAHITAGTLSKGAVRVSPSFKTEKKEIKNLLNFVKKIAL